MRIIYYTDKDGRIVHHHAPPESMSPQETDEAVRAYNLEPGHDRTAHVQDAENDGLTAYLFRKTAEKRQLDKQAVQDAIDSLEDALDTVRGLM